MAIDICSTKKVIRAKKDQAWKFILNIYLKEFLELFWPAAYQDIDWEKDFEFLEQEMIGIDLSLTKDRVLDKLVKFSLKNKTSRLIHIEIQGKKEKNFCTRMYIYNYLAFNKYQIDVSSIAILIDSNRSWKPTQYSTDSWGASIQMKFPIIKLIDFIGKEEELRSHSNPFAIVMLCQLKALAAKRSEDLKLAYKKEMVKLLYDRGFDKEIVMNIGKFLDGIFVLSQLNAIEYQEYVQDLEKEKNVSYLTTFEEFGLERGLKLGREQGRQEGRQEGRQAGERILFRHLLNVKFNDISSYYEDKINLAKDKQLIQWSERLLYCNSLEQIFED